MQKITVHTGRPYDILIDDGLLEQAGAAVPNPPTPPESNSEP